MCTNQSCDRQLDVLEGKQLKVDGVFRIKSAFFLIFELHSSAFLNLNGHTYLRLDGATDVDRRQRLMDRFNNDKRVFCFILSTRSGGLGKCYLQPVNVASPCSSLSQRKRYQSTQASILQVPTRSFSMIGTNTFVH